MIIILTKQLAKHLYLFAHRCSTRLAQRLATAGVAEWPADPASLSAPVARKSSEPEDLEALVAAVLQAPRHDALPAALERPPAAGERDGVQIRLTMPAGEGSPQHLTPTERTSTTLASVPVASD